MFYIVSYGLLLYRTTINAVKLLVKGNGINENALITISCLGALLLGDVMEGMMVITLYTIGKILEEKAINNSRKSIKELLDIKEPYAYKKEKNKIDKVKVEDVLVGDIIETIKRAAGKLVEEVKVFDIYEGENVGADEKSVAFKLKFSDPCRTLTDDEVMTIFNKVIDKVVATYKAQLRDK